MVFTLPVVGIQIIGSVLPGDSGPRLPLLTLKGS